MKNIKSLILGLAATATLATSCNVVDLDPTDRYSPATVWATVQSADQYVIGFYATFRTNTDIEGSQGLFTDAHSDLIKSSSWDLYAHSFNKVALESTSFTNDGAGVFECWGNDYNRIRRQNEFLRDAPEYGSKFGKDFVNTRMAEIRFCRAYTYMHLIRVYGGVVLRTEVDGPAQNNKARATEAETWAQVIEDLQFAADNLPAPDQTQLPTGRATRAAAYGLLSRAALYAKQWDVAVTAANQAKECGGALYHSKEGKNRSYAELFDNSRLDTNPDIAKEMLFTVRYDAATISHNHEKYFRPSYDGSQSLYNTEVYGAFGPTSELADKYEMAGTKGAFSWDKHSAAPYTDREPRFYASILYNGAPWEGRTIQTYEGGTDAAQDFELAGARKGTTTGYYFRKFITEGTSPATNTTWVTTGSEHFYPICRYAEVLLNKAEALAQQDYGKNKVEALAALNEVRDRVGLPARNSANLEAFMEDLRHERIVELAGEGFRYWDLRRWKLSEQKLNDQAMHGVRITKNEDGSFAYRQVEVDAGRTRIFLDKYYAFSIPIAERTNNTALGSNNPGW